MESKIQPPNPSEEQPAEAAVADDIESFEQLDQRLTVTNRKTWFALSGLFLLLALFVIWAFFGSIPVYVQGRGIVMNEKGVFVAQARTAGILQNIKVQVGDLVKPGQVLAEIFDPEIELALKTAQASVDFAQEDLSRLQKLVKKEEEANKIALHTDLEAKKFALSQLIAELPNLEHSVEAKKQLYQDGLIRFNVFTQAADELSQKRTAIEGLKANISSIEADLIRGYRTEELNAKENHLQLMREALKKVELQKSFAAIYASGEGVILAIQQQQGTLVPAGTSVFWLEHTASDKTRHLIYAYVPIDVGNTIPLNAPALIELATVNSQEFGAMKGKVIDVSLYAISAEILNNLIHNPGLVQYLMEEKNASVQVIVEPLLNPNTQSGYQWTSGYGPPMEIATGTICTVKTTVELIRPIYYAFPIWKLKEVESWILPAKKKDVKNGKDDPSMRQQ